MENNSEKKVGFFGRMKKNSQMFGMEQIVKVLPFLSKKNLVSFISLYEKMAKGDNKVLIGKLKTVLETTPAADIIIRATKLMNSKSLKKFAIGLIADGFLMRDERRRKIVEAGGAVPTVVLISPTMRCNLKCTGCYAYNYSKTDDLPYEVVDRVVNEAQAMGTAFVTILGGEPLMWEPLFDLFNAHQDMYFNFFSNGTLMTTEIAKKLAKAGNAMVTFSIEGFKKETDQRRGDGVYEKVLKAMDILRAEGVPFGFSAAVTNINEPIITSDEFADLMVEKGALIGWFFLYMPVGKDPDLSLMPTPEQRLHLLEFDKKSRATRPLFIIDFWNDAPYVGGCIAGKQYIHITSSGDVEPCIFTHLAQDNIKDKSLTEVMNSEFFKRLRAKQPYSDNLYLPCMWIDHPEFSRELMKDLDLKVTHPGADDIIQKEDLRKGIDEYSAKVKELYADVWEKDFAGGKPNSADWANGTTCGNQVGCASCHQHDLAEIEEEAKEAIEK